MKHISTVFILILIISIYAFADLINVQITGEGKINSGDVTKARSDAFNDAMSKAVEEGVKSFLVQSIVNENHELIKNNIYSKAGGYIKSIEIINEKIDNKKPDTYKITANASIITDNIQRDLTNLNLYKYKDRLPGVLVFIQEKNIDNVHWHFQTKNLNTSEKKVREVFRLNKFRVVDQDVLLNEIKPDEERGFYTENLSAIISISQRYGADLVIVGKAISRSPQDRANQNVDLQIQASVSLQAIQVDNGKTIAAGTGLTQITHKDAIVGGEMAIAMAAKDAANELIANLSRSGSQNIVSGIDILMIVSGLKSLESLILFQKEFKRNVAELRSIKRRTFSDGTAAYDLVSSLDGTKIADRLLLPGLNSFNVKVRSKSEKYLELNVKIR